MSIFLLTIIIQLTLCLPIMQVRRSAEGYIVSVDGVHYNLPSTSGTEPLVEAIESYIQGIPVRNIHSILLIIQTSMQRVESVSGTPLFSICVPGDDAGSDNEFQPYEPPPAVPNDHVVNSNDHINEFGMLVATNQVDIADFQENIIQDDSGKYLKYIAEVKDLKHNLLFRSNKHSSENNALNDAYGQIVHWIQTGEYHLPQTTMKAKSAFFILTAKHHLQNPTMYVEQIEGDFQLSTVFLGHHFISHIHHTVDEASEEIYNMMITYMHNRWSYWHIPTVSADDGIHDGIYIHKVSAIVLSIGLILRNPVLLSCGLIMGWINCYSIVGSSEYDTCESINDTPDKHCTRHYAITVSAESNEKLSLQLGNTHIGIDKVSPYLEHTLNYERSCFGGYPQISNEHTKKNECIKHKFSNDFCKVDCHDSMYGKKGNTLQTYTVCLDVRTLAEFYEMEIFKIVSNTLHNVVDFSINDESFTFDTNDHNATYERDNMTVSVKLVSEKQLSNSRLQSHNFLLTERNSMGQVQRRFTADDVKFGIHDICGFKSINGTPAYRETFHTLRKEYYATWNKHWKYTYVGIQDRTIYNSINETGLLYNINGLQLTSKLQTSNVNAIYYVSQYFVNDCNGAAKREDGTPNCNYVIIFPAQYTDEHQNSVNCLYLYNNIFYVSRLINEMNRVTDTVNLYCYDVYFKQNIYIDMTFYVRNETFKLMMLNSDASELVSNLYEPVSANYIMNIELNDTYDIIVNAIRCVGSIYADLISKNNTYKICFQGCDGTFVRSDAGDYCKLEAGCCIIYTLRNDHLCLADNYGDNCIKVKLYDNYNPWIPVDGEQQSWYSKHKKTINWVLILICGALLLILLIVIICKCCKRKQSIVYGNQAYKKWI